MKNVSNLDEKFENKRVRRKTKKRMREGKLTHDSFDSST